MKISSTVLVCLISSVLTLSAQNQNNNSSSLGDCENLIFNTVELSPFEFNERCKTESYPFISNDGQHLFYTNNQSYDWLFYCQKEQSTGKWTVPVPLSIAGFKDPIRSCWLSKEMDELYFVSGSKLYKCVQTEEKSKTKWTDVEEIQIVNTIDNSISGPLSYLSFNSDKSIMYAYVNNREEHSNMCKYVKTGDNTYAFNGSVSVYKREMGMLSMDGLTYYFTDDDFPYVLFCKVRNDVKEEFGATVYKVKEFERHLRVTQLRMAESADKMVMVLSDIFWNRNDIFFMDFQMKDSSTQYGIFDERAFRASFNQGTVMPNTLIQEPTIANPVLKKEVINTKGAEMCKIELGQAFPNPAKNVFYFYYSVSSENYTEEMPVVKVLDNAGRVVYTLQLDDLRGEAKVLLEDVPSGSYMIRIEYKGVSSDQIRITITQ